MHGFAYVHPHHRQAHIAQMEASMQRPTASLRRQHLQTHPCYVEARGSLFCPTRHNTAAPLEPTGPSNPTPQSIGNSIAVLWLCLFIIFTGLFRS